MQEGSLRVDANINLHIDTPAGRVATPIVEVKNMNSFRAVERAMAYEAQRQYEIWQETGQRLGDVPKSTRGWDEATQTTYLQRDKEESSDYRYFPEPDLVPVTTTEAEVERVRGVAGRVAGRAPRPRWKQTYGITPYDSDVLVNQGRALVDYYIELAELCRRRQAGQQLGPAGRAADAQRAAASASSSFPLRPKQLAELIDTVRAGPADHQPRPRGVRRDDRRRQVAGRDDAGDGHRRRR